MACRLHTYAIEIFGSVDEGTFMYTYTLVYGEGSKVVFEYPNGDFSHISVALHIFAVA